jgi:hypothetical protein
MGEGTFERATMYYLLGWFPIYFIVGYIVYILGWEPVGLMGIVIAAVIFLIIVVPIVTHLEKKSQKF